MGSSGAHVLVRGVNSQIENLSMNQAYCEPFVLQSLCYSYTTLLLEQENTGIFHLVQLSFKRALSQNAYTIRNFGPDSATNCLRTDYDASFLYIGGGTKTYKQYSYQFPKTFNSLNVFRKAFVNSGWQMSAPYPGISEPYVY